MHNSLLLRWCSALFLVATPWAGVAAQRADFAPVLVEQNSSTDVLLQAVSAVDERVVWVSGHGATYVRTLDGGNTWTPGTVGPDTLQFRDVHALDASTAWLLAAGPGDMSRIYKTSDGGANWTLTFLNDQPGAFYDCLSFWDARHGIAFSDAVDGELVIIRTEDGGMTWDRIDPSRIPDAHPDGEGGFAASGTCLVTAGEADVWIGTGAGGAARVFHSPDRGDTWSVVSTPVVHGTPTSGIATLTFRDRRRGMALGGELRNTDGFTQNVAVTADGGRTWRAAAPPAFPGPVYGSAVVPALEGVVVAAGPGGMSFTADDGTTWTAIDEVTRWAVGFAPGGSVGWAVGPEGRVTRIAFDAR